jgi:hypothetical protein
MTARRFPRTPDPSSRPFDGGANPFAESTNPPPPAGPTDSPYASPEGAARDQSAAAEYVCTLPNRSRKVIWLGIAAAVLAAVSSSIAGISVWLGSWQLGTFLGLPISFMTLAFAIPACTIGAADLRAIRAGAMDPAGYGTTRTGWLLGCVALGLGLFPTLAGIAALVMAMFA